MSCIFGENRDIFFPKLSESLHLIYFVDIAIKYLNDKGFEPYLCDTEDEARELIKTLPGQGKWPCLFTKSDTTGEKDFEEFYTSTEDINFKKFEGIGVINNNLNYDNSKLDRFLDGIEDLKRSKIWHKEDIVNLFIDILPDFDHKETGKHLDQKM